jgi:cobaltochelatase CobS
MSDNSISNLPAELVTMMAEYVNEHKSSPFNNRRNKLRNLVDYIYEKSLDRHDMQDINDALEAWLIDYRDRITPDAAQKAVKPTFNSWRSQLGIKGLESFVYYMIDDALDRNGFAHSKNEVKNWVDYSLSGHYNHSAVAFGLTEEMIELTDRLSKKIDYLFSSPVENKSQDQDQDNDVDAGVVSVDGFGGDGVGIVLEDGHKTLVDGILKLAGHGCVDEINGQIVALAADAQTSKEQMETMTKQLSVAMNKVAMPSTVNASHDGSLPEGEVVMTMASDIFTEIKGELSELLKFEVPVFEWDGHHRDVPTVDANYEYDTKALYRVLQGIVDSNNTYLFGHTGTGKSTLVEQVCARLNFPLVRVNFDSEISRMDLVGRDTLIEENGMTVSKFVDGVLPDALSRPCVLLCDEVDFIRPDVMYVFQRVLEGNGLLISEDGGRKVIANPWFRLIATANTCGQGDESGMYQGARPQSMATLDRFENWVSVDYMEPEKETAWLKSSNPLLPDSVASMLVEYAVEHRVAFMEGKIMQPLSPRGLRAMARRYVSAMALINHQTDALGEAFGSTILDRCTSQDKVVLEGLYQRISI